jgi:hypothetical protein
VLRRVTTVVPFGDLDAFVAEIDFDAELATEGVDAAAEGVDLNVFDLTFHALRGGVVVVRIVVTDRRLREFKLTDLQSACLDVC